MSLAAPAHARASRAAQRLGFAREERLLKYYLNGVDAFRLKLWFDPPVSPDPADPADPGAVEGGAAAAAPPAAQRPPPPPSAT